MWDLILSLAYHSVFAVYTIAFYELARFLMGCGRRTTVVEVRHLDERA